MTLYFQDKLGHEILVQKHIPSFEGVLRAIELDLKKRKPNFKSYYYHCSKFSNDEYWIDYGSHVEFYITKPDESN